MTTHIFEAIIMPRIEISEKLANALCEKWREEHPYDEDEKLTQINKDLIKEYLKED